MEGDFDPDAQDQVIGLVNELVIEIADLAEDFRVHLGVGFPALRVVGEEGLGELLENALVELGQLARVGLFRQDAGAAHHAIDQLVGKRDRQVEQPDARLGIHAEKDAMIFHAAFLDHFAVGLDLDGGEFEVEAEAQEIAQAAGGEPQEIAVPLFQALLAGRREGGNGWKIGYGPGCEILRRVRLAMRSGSAISVALMVVSPTARADR